MLPNIYYCFEISLCEICRDSATDRTQKINRAQRRHIVVSLCAFCHLLGSLVNKWYTFWILNPFPNARPPSAKRIQRNKIKLGGGEWASTLGTRPCNTSIGFICLFAHTVSSVFFGWIFCTFSLLCIPFVTVSVAAAPFASQAIWKFANYIHIVCVLFSTDSVRLKCRKHCDRMAKILVTQKKKYYTNEIIMEEENEV